MFCKPTADIFIDDKGINSEDWKKQCPQIKGIVAGAFDVIHSGYIKLFKECKYHCNHLTVALHENPSLERPNKIAPIHSSQEREEILKSIKYIDNVVRYQKENTFLSFLKDYDIRFLGEDYKDGSYTGKDLPIKIVFIDRSHNWSTTKFKKMIYEQFINQI
jgi:glycerol-3-phosphate cytidylyltransferase